MFGGTSVSYGLRAIHAKTAQEKFPSLLSQLLEHWVTDLVDREVRAISADVMDEARVLRHRSIVAIVVEVYRPAKRARPVGQDVHGYSDRRRCDDAVRPYDLRVRSGIAISLGLRRETCFV